MKRVAGQSSAQAIVPAWVPEPQTETAYIKQAYVRACTPDPGPLVNADYFLGSAPTTEAMRPTYPAGRPIVFDGTPHAKPKDGDIVLAFVQLWPRGFSTNKELQKLYREFTCIRRLESSAKGAEVLVPLALGFSSWSAGQREGRRVQIIVLGVATPHKAWAVDYIVRATEVKAA